MACHDVEGRGGHVDRRAVGDLHVAVGRLLDDVGTASVRTAAPAASATTTAAAARSASSECAGTAGRARGPAAAGCCRSPHAASGPVDAAEHLHLGRRGGLGGRGRGVEAPRRSTGAAGKRSTRRSPTMRSSAAICWLTYGCGIRARSPLLRRARARQPGAPPDGAILAPSHPSGFMIDSDHISICSYGNAVPR